MDGLELSLEKMRREGLPEIARQSFEHYYRRLAAGEQGMLPESEIEPAVGVVDAESLPEGDDALLDQAVVIKLNGGLGTSMGMTGPKSLIEAREGQTFLDITVQQVLRLRERSGARVPLVLMNSFRTREQSLAALRRHPELELDVPLDFVQGKVPKLRADDLTPVEWPADPELEWAPPGHGDLYTSIVASGVLETLLEKGYRYAFVSNSDNLGAVLEPRILRWFAERDLPFAMEVAERTESDKKGGHLARRRGGGLVLRETSQISADDQQAFEDVERHRYFNANTLWIDLDALARTLRERDGVLGLPMIVNRKTVDPSDPDSPAVIQLESAMGAAIDVFEGADAVRVPRRRFVPVKTTNDLLALRSDAYRIAPDSAQVSLLPERADTPPVIDLDAANYKLLADFERRFAAGPPSLIACERLTVNGDVSFGRGVVVRGAVTVDGPARIEDGALLEG
ncbi:MAG TPA: UTP--glucose-1-phosphate uridylyltransferase [Thermoleophilaceae bacterium]